MHTVKLTERQFMRQVADFAKLCRWRVAHFRPSRTATGWRTACQFDAAGFPDLLLVRGPRLVVAELKVGGRGLTAEQEDWIAAFHATGVEAYCWRPSDWDLIERVLRC